MVVDLESKIRKLTGAFDISIVELEMLERDITSGDFSPIRITDNFRSFVKSFNELSRYKNNRRIFFSSDVCSTIDEIEKVTYKSFEIGRFLHPCDFKIGKERVESLAKDIKTELTGLKELLESEFRAMLGIK